MSVLQTDVTKAFYVLLEATWPDVNKFLAETDADRIDWLRAIRAFRTTGAGLLKTPFVVVSWGRMSETAKGGVCNQEYDWAVSVALVVSLASTESTENYLMTMLDSLKTALLASTVAAQSFQVLGVPSTDYSPRSMANELMVKGNLPYMAAQLDTVLRVGSTP